MADRQSEQGSAMDRLPPSAAIHGSEKKLPALLPAVGVSCGEFQQLAEPGGTSKLLETLFM